MFKEFQPRHYLLHKSLPDLLTQATTYRLYHEDWVAYTPVRDELDPIINRWRHDFNETTDDLYWPNKADIYNLPCMKRLLEEYGANFLNGRDVEGTMLESLASVRNEFLAEVHSWNASIVKSLAGQINGRHRNKDANLRIDAEAETHSALDKKLFECVFCKDILMGDSEGLALLIHACLAERTYSASLHESQNHSSWRWLGTRTTDRVWDSTSIKYSAEAVSPPILSWVFLI